jgi:hypothetical protein
MDLELNESITFEAMQRVLSERLPYKISLKKNPLLRFEYIVVQKTAFVGAWIRIFPKQNKVQLIKAIPSDIARAFFGGLIVLLFLSSAQRAVLEEISQVLIPEFGTKVI